MAPHALIGTLRHDPAPLPAGPRAADRVIRRRTPLGAIVRTGPRAVKRNVAS
jgi:hypothetical protein